MKIEIKKIRTEEGLLQLNSILKENVQNANGLEILETETGKVWENFGGFNGIFTDLWLRKKGTNGNQSRTFIRVSVGKFEDVANELRWMNIEASSELLKKVEEEKQAAEVELQKTQAIIDGFNDAEKLREWKEKLATKNSQAARTFAKNKLMQLGAKLVPAGYAREFQRKMEAAI